MVDVAKKRALLLFGGRSAEHEISVISARFIHGSLCQAGHDVTLVGIAPNGRWHLQTEDQLPNVSDPRDVAVDQTGPHAYLKPMPSLDGQGALFVEQSGETSVQGFDVVFPVLHGPLGEDGCIQGLLELNNVPYVGSGVTGCAVGMDKIIQKQVFADAGLPMVDYLGLTKNSYRHNRARTLDRAEQLRYPLFVKPANMGSSVGISRAKDRSSLERAVEVALSFDSRVVIEVGLNTPREIECAVLGNHDLSVSVAGEIVVNHPDGFYSYDAKYIDNGAALNIPAGLTNEQQEEVNRLARRAFEVLDLAGMARVDMFMTADHKLYLNEVNTIPGFTSISMYPELWKASGVGAAELVSRLIELALQRFSSRSALSSTADISG